jgi:hypothetical protein
MQTERRRQHLGSRHFMKGESMHNGKIKIMCFGLGGKYGEGVSDSGGSLSSHWYLSSPEQFLKCI